MEKHHHRFADRGGAGRELARSLHRFASADPIVVGLPRGGVPVAEAVADALDAPLDVIVVRKIGAPSQPELGIGAVAEGDVQVIDMELAHRLAITSDEITRLVRERVNELDQRIAAIRSVRSRLDLADRFVIVVDDGLATGSTAHAAIRSAQRSGASHVVLAVPVGSREAVQRLGHIADEVICLETPRIFLAVGHYYDHFDQVSDDQVRHALQGHDGVDVIVPSGESRLPAHLTVPYGSMSLVVFAHGSGSSRMSPRNREVARLLNRAGIATLLMDLLTPDEAADRRNVFDVELLADRLVDAVTWCQLDPRVQQHTIALFGASTGAAAALIAAARRPRVVRAVVSRGGRPDLAGPWLAGVAAPTLLIVGGDDREVRELNRAAMTRLTCPARLEVVPGATHLFEEAGTLARAAAAARDWFLARAAPGVP